MFFRAVSTLPQELRNDKKLLLAVQLMALAYENLPAMILVNFAAACGALLVLHRDGKSVLAWLVAVLVLSGFRLASFFLFRRSSVAGKLTNVDRVDAWGIVYATGLIGAAIYWVALLLMSFQNAELVSRFTLIVIIAALSGGATGIVAPLKYIGRIYISIMLLCSSMIIYISAPEYWVLSVLGATFWLVMIFSHKNNHKVLIQSLLLKWDNEKLIHDLKRLNSDLEARVVQRTQALKKLAHQDPLTGLPNRAGLMEWMELNLDEKNHNEAAVLFLDLDRFKQINDALGHDVGDVVLRMISMRFFDLCPSNSVLARWGGDEFLVVTAQEENAREHAETLAYQLIKAATAPLQINGQTLGLGLSIGMAFFPTDAVEFSSVIQAADLTVAEVKRNGRGASLFYTQTYADTQRRRFDLGRALEKAIARDELTLAFQPIVNVKTQKLEALEVLARWNHNELGVINPVEFIPLAEETDRIISLGQWVMSKALEKAAQWEGDLREANISVNVSIKQLLSGSFVGFVKSVLSATAFSPNRLILEVTESLFAESYLDITLQRVKELRELGIHVYIDDFGTGYSSLSRLHEFPVTGIKIDKSFTHQIAHQGLVIIESALLIARRMNLRVIVEGVETAEQAETLANLGILHMQGYFFGKPCADPAPLTQHAEAK